MENCCLGKEWKQIPAQRWCCDTLLPIEGRASISHSFDNSQQGCDYLVFRHDPLSIQDSFAYSFRIRHGYLPSAQNNWQFVLGATIDAGSEPGGEDFKIISAVLVGVNFSGSDDLIKIWALQNGEPRMLCSSTLNYQEEAGSSLSPLFRVEGDGAGSLDLFWTPDPAEQLPELLSSCRIDGLSWGRQLLLRYQYSSSRDRALWMDELVLEGTFAKDTTAPEVSAVRHLNPQTLQIEFSEKVLMSDSSSFILFSEDTPGGMEPESIRHFGQEVQISFPDPIPNRKLCKLQIRGVEDLDGNQLTFAILELIRNQAAWGDVVFNEIMFDPDPGVLYEEEYLELFNRSGFPLQMEGWQLHVNDRTYILDASLMTGSQGNFICLSGITLPNEGAVLSLCNQEGTLIHACSYKIPWNGPDWKKEGGWSLESPDADQICRISANWQFSTDPGGGTPGRINSIEGIMVDQDPPVLLYAGEGDPGELYLHYHEPLRFSQDLEETFRLGPGAVPADSFRLMDPIRDILHLYFPKDFHNWQNYQLQLPGLMDCAGNRSRKEIIEAGALSIPGPGSVLINEIMYDPEEDHPGYIELYLPGNRIFDLKDLAIHLVGTDGSPDHPIPLSSHSRLFLPGQYLVLTDCAAHLQEAYGLVISGQWVEVAELPGLNSSSGRIFLTDRAGQVVDMAEYGDELHMELLEDPRGISLERISADRPGNDPDNWHSAASIAGYATPGRENSQALGIALTEEVLEVSPEVFSPDNDGHEDLLSICLNTGGQDWVIGLLITDLQGKHIRMLANNHLAAPSVTYTWNGKGEDGSMQPMGFYVIHARAYNPVTGMQWVRRKAVGLVYR